MNKLMKKMPPKAKSSTLRFTPYAWAKLLFLRDLGETEVGGFGISSPSDLLLVEDIELIRQSCTEVTVEFHDESVADFFDRQVDAGRRPEEFGRIWVHTHPGDSARPSGTDESTFCRVFGSSSWALMFILAKEGETYARLRFNSGPGGELLLPVEVDYSLPFAGSDHAAWEEEYADNVQPIQNRWPRLERLTGTMAALDEEQRIDAWLREMQSTFGEVRDDFIPGSF